MSKESVLCLIPARGGSKGISRKNLCKVNGISLLERAINVALELKRLDKIVVTSDDDEILSIAGKYEVDILKRPIEYSDDKATSVQYTNHALEYYKSQRQEFDNILLLEPTSPFRTAETIDDCINKLISTDANTVITVTQLERNPGYIFRVNKDKAERYIKEPKPRYIQRQEFTELKRLNGCVYVFRKKNLQNNVIVLDPVYVVEMDSKYAVNIDEQIDLEFAEFLAKKYNW